MWSQFGDVIVPSDKDVNDPTDVRDWITVSATIPDELVGLISAGLFFRIGSYVPGATYMQGKYVGFACRSARFFNFAYVENYQNIAGNHKLIILNAYEFDSEFELITHLGPFFDPSGDLTADYNILHGAPLTPTGWATPTLVRNNIPAGTGFQSSWVDFDTTNYETLRYWLNAVGELRINGGIKNPNPFIAGQVVNIFQLPAGLRPLKNCVRFGMSLGATLAPCRIDIATNGVVLWQGNAAYSANNYIGIDFTIPLNNFSS